MRSEAAVRPDPATEIRLVSLSTLRGKNFWATRPVTRVDVAVGAYDEISSADVDGFTDRLVAALPGLWEHRCSIGEPGGFVTRLRCGTYAPHIMEHVALELQGQIGHGVGYGRARGGDREGEYTVVFEHRHAQVGLRTAALALDVVQRAFAGTLDGVEHALAELRQHAATEDVPAVGGEVLCGITGGGGRNAARAAMLRLGVPPAELIVDLAPGYLLSAGLPYARSEVGVVLDAAPADVPERYRDPERARQLVSVVADGVRRGGIVVLPAAERELQELAHDADRRVAVFSCDATVPAGGLRRAHSAATVHDGRVRLECCGTRHDLGALDAALPAAPQVAAALAVHSLRELNAFDENRNGSQR